MAMAMASPSSSIVAVLLLLLFFLHGSFTVCSSSDGDAAGSSSKPRKAKLLGDGGGERGRQNPEKNPILKAKKQTVLLKPTVSAADAAGSSSKAKLLIRRSVGEGDGGERGQNPEKNPILKPTVSAADAAGSSSKAQKAKLLIRRSVGEGDGGEREQNPEKNPILKAKQQTKLGKSFNATLKASNSSKENSNSTKSSKDKLKSPNSASNSTKSSKKLGLDSPIAKNKIESSVKVNEKAKTAAKQGAKTEELAVGMETEDELDDGIDIISDFRELPSRLLPDLERLSVTSKAYISAANKGIAEGVKPYVGKSFAPKVAPVLSSLFLVPPLLLLFLTFRRLRAYISHHRLLLFTQAHLAIYFGTLMLTALATGLEPLCFFYATWPASYVWTQAAQTMGYLIYLVLQLSDLVSLFSGSKDSHTASSRSLALAQMVIGLAVGIHYYAAVFHRAVCGEPPRVNWRVHGVYATCFLAICMCARADRRKKAYCDCEGGEVGKKN